ncbi:hypothetical protein [Paraburkholderia caribensis]|uniref:hypothetical protein n=1 Tax=Paraburkholderia caribensis TaxID=75105 RepID=UPI000B0AB248|nr:hypothetical protein [Paraburkholderia caribensis]
MQYINGPVGVAAGIMRNKNSTLGGGTWGRNSTADSGGEPGISAINIGYQTAATQQRVAVTGGYELTSTLGVSASYANVQYIPGNKSTFTSTAIFNVAGAVVHWTPVPAWQFAAGYSYTCATKANGISDAARYQEITFSESYKLSKRTSVYALQGYTHASGKTVGSLGGSNIINATATVGDGYNSGPSSTQDQFVAVAGLVTRF